MYPAGTKSLVESETSARGRHLGNANQTRRRLFPPKDLHLESRFRTRGFPNHGSFSFSGLVFSQWPVP
jgi:hypothetical protein